MTPDIVDVLPFLIIVVLLIVLLEGLFSGGEIALVSCDINRVRQKAAAGSRSARIALDLLEQPERFLSTTLTGTDLCQISNTALVTSTFILIWGPERGALAASVVMVPLLLIVGEIIPKSLFQHHADWAALRIAWFIRAASWIFYPVVTVLSRISRSAIYVFSKQAGLFYTPYITRSGLESLLRREGGTTDITQMEKEMIKKVLDFSEYTVEEIMVPLSNVAVISLHATLDEAAAVVKERNYSRIPVYDREVLNIVGIIDSFDLMDDLARRGKDAPLVPEENGDGRVRRQILFVPETKRARDLFLELQRHGEHMAVVVDEYGGAVGIITMEDIQEEIVGDINDEDHDSAATLIRPSGRGRYIVDGQVKTDYLQTTLGVTVPEGDYETVGGFLLAAMGKIPKPRESYRLGNIVFVVEEADLRSIKKILLLIPPEVSAMKRSDPMP